MQLTEHQQKELEDRITAVREEVQKHVDHVNRLEAALSAARAQRNGAEGYLQALEVLLGESTELTLHDRANGEE